MENVIKVSVIMPVYNAADFLNDTLRDVTGQTLREIEIICVDDGSKDNSIDIIKEWQKKDDRIQLISQQNQYAGVARNHGFAASKGKYVVFWDSDDIFYEHALEKLYCQLEATGADLCVCGAQRYDMEREKYITSDAYLRKSLMPDKEVFNKKDTPYLFNFATNNPWNKMYRAEFIRKNDLQFQAIKQANDTYFTMMALFLAETITYVDEVLIGYRVNNAGSLTGKASDTVFCVYESYAYTIEHMQKYPEFELVKKSFANHALNGFYHALNNQRNFTSYEKLYNKYKTEGFAYFGIDSVLPEDFIYEWQYRDMQRVKDMPAVEFLVLKSEERRLNGERARNARDTLKEERKETKKEIRALQKEIEKSNKQIQKLQNELTRIRASKTYKVGKIIVGFPSAVKRVFIKKRKG